MVIVQRKPDEGIVAELEALLVQARSGELYGFTILGELTGGRIHTFHSSTDSVQTLGHLARMMATANTALDDAVEPRTGSR